LSAPTWANDILCDSAKKRSGR